MNAPGKIVSYLLGTVLLGALLAPPLFWAGQALAARGILQFLAETEFQRFFNRAMLVAAIVLLWPTVRWLNIRSVQELGLQRDQHWLRHLLAGFAIAAVLVAVMAAAYLQIGVYRLKSDIPWGKIPALALSAAAVALLEEALFRGALLGLFRRTLRPLRALFWVTSLFAVLHFLKPDDRVVVERVSWLSGFQLLPHTFHQFADPMTLYAAFTTLFVLGWILGYAALRTRALWMSIGLHAGVVFVKMTFSKFTKRDEEYLPWIGSKLEIGLVPVVVLAIAGLLIWVWLYYEDPHPRQTRS